MRGKQAWSRERLTRPEKALLRFSEVCKGFGQASQTCGGQIGWSGLLQDSNLLNLESDLNSKIRALYTRPDRGDLPPTVVSDRCIGK